MYVTLGGKEATASQQVSGEQALLFPQCLPSAASRGPVANRV